MYNLIVKVLTKSSPAVDTAITKSVVESKILTSLTQSIKLENKEAIDRFIAEIPKSDDLRRALNPILLNNKVDLAFISKLESELSKTMPKLAFKKESEHILLKELKLEDNLSANEIQNTIENNVKLKSLSEKFIDIVNRNKLRLATVTLGSATVGAYLHESAKNLSGCYKIAKDGVSIECKAGCGESLNDKFCNTNYNNKVCDEESCKELHSVDSGSKYTCINVKWYQALGYVVNKFSSGILQTVWKIAKYFLVFVIGLVTFRMMSKYDWKYRLGVASMSMVGAGFTVF